MEAHRMISEQIDYPSTGKYMLSYYFIKSIYYLNNNRSKLIPFLKFVLSHMKNNISSFGVDPIFVKSIFKKIGHRSEYMHEFYLKEIINSCSTENLSDWY